MNSRLATAGSRSAAEDRFAGPVLIRCLLVANRGEIARRVMHTARRLGVQTVAVYSDADAQALHVAEADFAVGLGGLTSADSYLRVDKLLAAARQCGADAVHPGYGFLSENADFAQAVIDAGLIWVGPPPAAIRALGNKSAAKTLAQARGVPVLPGYHGHEQGDAHLKAQAQAIGAPIMIKAVAGGGGRGMRLVSDLAGFDAALASARSEALAAFGCADVLIERALLAPRHVEVQVFVDAHGACIHLGERDCSVQRRHQKLIEESPSPAVSPALREAMGECAVALARAAGYVGAGTVEFLLEGDAFYLMEMNTRLQVEHPVTEALTGLDLVEWQLRVATGEALALVQNDLRFVGHAIEVRLCAEDEQFHPQAGRVEVFVPPASASFDAQRLPPAGFGLRMDHALFAGQVVSPFYDSMLGKLIVHAPTREEAIEHLATALDRLVLLGISNNRQFLAAALRHPQFRAGEAGIAFLQHAAEPIRATLHEAQRQALDAAALAVWQPNGPSAALPARVPRVLRVAHRGKTHERVLNEADASEPARKPTAGSQRVHRVPLGEGNWHVQVGAADLVLRDTCFEPPQGSGSADGAGELRAPFNGKLLALHVAVGQAVKKGEVLAVIESMKLEHALGASADGVVAGLHAAAGQQVSTGQLLLRFAQGAAT